jgi:transcription antitermination factor NusG
MYWIAVYVNHAFTFKEWLQKHYKIESYVPVSKQLTKPSRKRQPVQTIRAAFGNYVFIEIDPSRPIWQLLRDAPGFFYILAPNGAPAEIDPSSIATIRQFEISGLFDNIQSDVSIVFKKGVGVQIVLGPFAGERGSIIVPPKKGVAKIEMRNGIAKIPLSNIEVLRHSHDRTSLDDPSAPLGEQRSSPRGRPEPQSS